MAVNERRLLRCLNPNSVAVIGGKEAERVLQQCQKLDFQGKLWAINAKREYLAGIPCVDSIDDLPQSPDVVFVGVPAEATIELVGQLNKAGAGGAVCLASGFKEVGEDGRDRQHSLIQAAGDMPVLGPNCYGYINTLVGAALFPDQHGLTRTESGVAIISSSGNIGINFTLQQRGLPISWLITIGNQAVIGIEEAVSAALQNDKIKAIGLHIEGLKNIPLFIELAQQAREKRIPIIVLKTGKSSIGAQITLSHTATMAGESGLYAALFERLGIGLMDNIEDFLEALKLAHVVGPLKGNHIASLSCSGGEASLIADLSSSKNLVFPEITPSHRKRLQQTLNEYVAIHNPLDYHTFIWGDKERTTNTFAAMMEGGYDLTLLIIDYPHINNCDMTEWIGTTHAFIDACKRTQSRGAVVTCLSENFTDEVRQLLIDNGVAPLHGMQQALASIEALCSIGMKWHENISPPMVTRVNGSVAQQPISTLNEADAKQLLGSHGIPVARGELISIQDDATCNGAVQAANRIGYPVVLKAISSDIAHKSELGAVVVGVNDDNTLSEHIKQLSQLSNTILVEQMISDSVVELLVGVSYDALFGHYLILGFGGVMVELIRDRQILFLPTDEKQVLDALAKLKTWPLLNGFRGRDKADIDAVIQVVIKIAELVQQQSDRIVELEVNPLMVRSENKGVVVVDALIQTKT